MTVPSVGEVQDLDPATGVHVPRISSDIPGLPAHLPPSGRHSQHAVSAPAMHDTAFC